LSTISAELKLARRLEEAEAFAAEAYAYQATRRRPGADVVVEEVAGGRVVYAGPGSPLTEAKAIGLHGPVSDADLDRMEAVFFSRGEPSRVVVCPLADPSLVEGLGRRGYRLARFENILAMPLGPDDPKTSFIAGIEVRPIDASEGDLYVKVVAPNFVGPGELTEDAMEMMAGMLGMEHARSFLAFIDGEPVGGGSVLIHEGLALFAGAATSPPYRNRGVHAALHHARLAFAIRSGCDVAAQGAEPGGTSQRNAERRGLRVAYTRAILLREPAFHGS
jgi:GNAT superfamily N-acetyltransferase